MVLCVSLLLIPFSPPLADAGVTLEYAPEKNELIALTYDKELTYEKLRRITALWNMRNSANSAAGLRSIAGNPVDFVATHPDNCCPSEEGPIPDVGGMLKLLETTNGMKPSHVFGKPSPTLLEPVLANFKKEGELLIIQFFEVTKSERFFLSSCSDFIGAF